MSGGPEKAVGTPPPVLSGRILIPEGWIPSEPLAIIARDTDRVSEERLDRDGRKNLTSLKPTNGPLLLDRQINYPLWTRQFGKPTFCIG